MRRPDRSQEAAPPPRCWVAPDAPHVLQQPRLDPPADGWGRLQVLIMGDLRAAPTVLASGLLEVDGDREVGEVSRSGIHTWLQLYAGETWLRIHDYAIVARGVMLLDWNDPDSHRFWLEDRVRRGRSLAP